MKRVSLSIIQLTFLLWCRGITEAEGYGKMHEAKTTVDSNMTATPTTIRSNDTKSMDDKRSRIALIIGCVFVVVLVLLVAVIVALRYLLSTCTSRDDQGDQLEARWWKRVGTSTRNEKRVIKFHDITLTIAETDYLALDKESTIKFCPNVCFESLRVLGVIDAAPKIYEISPTGLEFLKPAKLTIRIKKATPGKEPFILRGYRHCQRIAWELVTNGVKTNKAKLKIVNTFSLYTYIFAKRETLARILSHINNSFCCRAYVFNRRSDSMETINISVVLVSEFVDEREEEKIKKLKYHLDEGYVKGEKGKLKAVDTDRNLEMRLDFPGTRVKTTPYVFKVDLSELDSDGFVVSHFKRIAIENPVGGSVEVYESSSDENQLLWKLNIEALHQPPSPRPEHVGVVFCNTKLNKGEIIGLSRAVGMDWDGLAGLMNIQYRVREEINFDTKYPSFSCKAEEIFALFNNVECFGRCSLQKFFKELRRHDLEEKMLDFKKGGCCKDKTADVRRVSQPEISKSDLENTPLSSREMYRLGLRIGVDWEQLARLMNIEKAERDDIRCNIRYIDARSKAEKILAIFNTSGGFSREELAKHLREMKQLKLIEPVTTGKWRAVEVSETHQCNFDIATIGSRASKMGLIN